METFFINIIVSGIFVVALVVVAVVNRKYVYILSLFFILASMGLLMVGFDLKAQFCADVTYFLLVVCLVKDTIITRIVDRLSARNK